MRLKVRFNGVPNGKVVKQRVSKTNFQPLGRPTAISSLVRKATHGISRKNLNRTATPSLIGVTVRQQTKREKPHAALPQEVVSDFRVLVPCDVAERCQTRTAGFIGETGGGVKRFSKRRETAKISLCREGVSVPLTALPETLRVLRQPARSINPVLIGGQIPSSDGSFSELTGEAKTASAVAVCG